MGGGSLRHLAAMEKLRRSMPADFAEIAESMSLHALCLHYRAGTATIQKWKAELGLKPLPPGRFTIRETPADFAARAASMTQNEARRHYNASTETVRRWYAECGLKPRKRGVNWGAPQTGNFGAAGDGSTASPAATHLRRIGFANVYRATVLDRAARAHLPDEGKHHFVVSGRGFMHQDDMIALATSSGFGSVAA